MHEWNSVLVRETCFDCQNSLRNATHNRIQAIELSERKKKCFELSLHILDYQLSQQSSAL